MAHKNSLNSSSHWSIDEINYLKQYYKYLSLSDISSNLYNYFFVDRSVESIRVKASRLNIKRK